jgi:hypothetical protein
MSLTPEGSGFGVGVTVQMLGERAALAGTKNTAVAIKAAPALQPRRSHRDAIAFVYGGR